MTKRSAFVVRFECAEPAPPRASRTGPGLRWWHRHPDAVDGETLAQYAARSFSGAHRVEVIDARSFRVFVEPEVTASHLASVLPPYPCSVAADVATHGAP